MAPLGPAVHALPGALVETQITSSTPSVSSPVGLGRDLRPYISTTLPGDAVAAPGTTFGEPPLCRTGVQKAPPRACLGTHHLYSPPIGGNSCKPPLMPGCGMWFPELDPRTRQEKQESWWSSPTLCHTSRSKDSILQRCPVRAGAWHVASSLSLSCTIRLVGCGRGGLPFPLLTPQTPRSNLRFSPNAAFSKAASLAPYPYGSSICSLQLSRFSDQYKSRNSPLRQAQESKGVTVRDWAARCHLWSRNSGILSQVGFWGHCHQFRALGGGFMGLASWK